MIHYFSGAKQQTPLSMIKVSLFNQILQIIPKDIFNNLVGAHQSDKHSKGITSWTHFVSMVFSHLSQSSSLREITTGLRSATGNLNHLGITRSPSRSSLFTLISIETLSSFRSFTLSFTTTLPLV